MSSKYGSQLSPTERWRLGGDARPLLSEHALKRWDERTPDDAASPEEAWEAGLEDDWLCEHPHFNQDDHDPDRVRVYHGDGFGAVFLVVTNEDDTFGTVTTILRVSEIWHRGVRSYCAGLTERDLQ